MNDPIRAGTRRVDVTLKVVVALAAVARFTMDHMRDEPDPEVRFMVLGAIKAALNSADDAAKDATDALEHLLNKMDGAAPRIAPNSA